MARGPDGTPLPEELEAEGLGDADTAFARGLEKIIDRAMHTLPPGDRFVYGIHQELSPAAIGVLVGRYREAGWSDAVIREGATGAYILVLTP